MKIFLHIKNQNEKYAKHCIGKHIKKLLSVFSVIFLQLIILFLFLGCEKEGQDNKDSQADKENVENSISYEWSELTYAYGMELRYAEKFSVDYYKEGYALLTVNKDSRYLLIPENRPIPSGLDKDITVLQKPFKNIYLVSTSGMDFFRAVDAMGNIRLSGTKAEGWYIEEAKAAMEKGDILYAGKYNAPDYELILAEKCDLAIENTMIYHSPEVKEKLESFDIPVFVDYSSYEKKPLGRLEWVKLYGLLNGKESEAEAFFNGLIKEAEEITAQENTGKTVAFFYITSNGAVNVRKSGDYIAETINMAGGSYILKDLHSEDGGQSMMNMQMEEFYSSAGNADVLIYNSTIEGELKGIESLLEKSVLLGDFKAVKEGNVWCIEKNLFQEITGLTGFIKDINDIVTGRADTKDRLNYMYRLK